jgi:hypothetical protein
MHLTDEEKDAYWRAGRNGGWQGCYEAGMSAGFQRAIAAMEQMLQDRFGRKDVEGLVAGLRNTMKREGL